MCFIHSDMSRRTFIEQISLGAAAAAAVSGVSATLAAANEGVAAPGIGKPDLIHLARRQQAAAKRLTRLQQRLAEEGVIP